MFDRSWYNRANVERVMGFCTEQEYDTFMVQAPLFENMLVASGIHLTKFWFSVTRREQRTRFAIRQIDPVRRWKLPQSTLPPWTGGRTTRTPRKRRSCAPTRTMRRGSPSSPTTRSGDGSTPCASSSTSSTTTTRTPRSCTTRTPSSCAAAAKPSATKSAGPARHRNTKRAVQTPAGLPAGVDVLTPERHIRTAVRPSAGELQSHGVCCILVRKNARKENHLSGN